MTIVTAAQKEEILFVVIDALPLFICNASKIKKRFLAFIQSLLFRNSSDNSSDSCSVAFVKVSFFNDASVFFSLSEPLVFYNRVDI